MLRTTLIAAALAITFYSLHAAADYGDRTSFTEFNFHTQSTGVSVNRVLAFSPYPADPKAAKIRVAIEAAQEEADRLGETVVVTLGDKIVAIRNPRR